MLNQSFPIGSTLYLISTSFSPIEAITLLIFTLHSINAQFELFIKPFPLQAGHEVK